MDTKLPQRECTTTSLVLKTEKAISKKYLATVNPKDEIQIFKHKDRTVSIKTIEKMQGAQAAISPICYFIYRIANFTSVGKGMTDNQVTQAAKLILEEYPYLTVPDLALFAKRVMKGHYGKLFDVLDGALIMFWMKQYHEERLEQAAFYKTNSYLEDKKKQEKELPVMSEKVAQMIADKMKPAAEKQKNKDGERKDEPSDTLTYQSIEHYCHLNDLDLKEYALKLEQEFKKEYDPKKGLTLDHFIIWRFAQHLNELNR